MCETRQEMRVIDRKELEEYGPQNKQGRHWISLWGHVYDITPFLNSHPGGGSALIRASGDVVDDVFLDGNHRLIKEKDVVRRIGKFMVGKFAGSSKVAEFSEKKPIESPLLQQAGGEGQGEEVYHIIRA